MSVVMYCILKKCIESNFSGIYFDLLYLQMEIGVNSVLKPCFILAL